MTFKLPLVSVIIVNYNYGHFLKDAILSVFNQQYDNIECVVVDNNSTDESRIILQELTTLHPELRVILRQANDGQCVASAEAYVETKGQYIVFMDADDVLLSDFVSTHIYVNLSLYMHVGFTFTDMLQIVDDQIVLGTCRTQRPETPDAARPLLRPFAWEAMERPALTPVVEGEVQLIDKAHKDWCYTATSAFMFRRDAVEMFIHNPSFGLLQCAFDVYMARGINAITGSVAINRSLCAYRMHSANIFSRHAQLERCYNFESGGSNDQSERARQQIIGHMFSNLQFFRKKIVMDDDFINAIYTVDRAMPKLRCPDGRFPSCGAACLVQNFDVASRLYGRSRVLSWCVKMGVPLRGLGRLFSQLWRQRANSVP